MLGVFVPAPSKGLQVQINTQARDGLLLHHEPGPSDDKDPKTSSDLQQVGSFKGHKI